MDLNIVTLNIPYPPDYGGMIDSFYRIKWLKTLSVRIHLHSFEYGREHSEELESLCETVNYYPRKTTLLNQFSRIPYIIKSRCSDQLLKNLRSNNFPILFDGLHTTFFLDHPDLARRKKYVRLHNIEHLYYRSLASSETQCLKRLFYKIESRKLIKYEEIIASSAHLFTISGHDYNFFASYFKEVILLPPFHPFEEIISNTGKGQYILYHGDLSVSENSLVACSLIKNVFSKLRYPCIIAGKNPPPCIETMAAVNKNIRIIPNPDSDEMDDLIRNAHISLLPALSSNGFKMKLLIALFSGRHCLVNSRSAENFPDKSVFQIADTNEQLIDKIDMLMNQEFTTEMIETRRNIIEETFSNERNARNLAEIIFG